MKIYTFQNEIPNYINEQLLEFEKCFTYPLDSKYSFRISHAPVYIDFFQSIGSSKFILAMEDHKIIGICVAIQKENAHYICDLKIHPQVKDKRLCYKILKQLRNMNSNSNLYAVYMEGTKNVQRFVQKQRIQNRNIQTKEFTIFRVQTGINISHNVDRHFQPIPIRTANAKAYLTHTALTKRLYLSNGTELNSTHLSDIQFNQISDLKDLLDKAILHSQNRGYPALFFSIPKAFELAIINSEKYVISTHTHATRVENFPLNTKYLNTAEV